MGKTRKFLGFFVFLVSVVFGANAFAAGYVCDDIKKYTSCNSGYFLSDCGTTYDGRTLSEGDLTVGNSCTECPGDTYDCSGGMMCPKSKTVTITLEKNGGTGDVSTTFDCLMDKPCDLPSAGLSKDGYQFSGWSSNNDATSGETTMTFSSDSVVYAAWSPNTYTVTFKIGAIELGTQSFTYGESQSLTKLSELSNVPAELSGHGWSFDGWSRWTTGTSVSLSDGGVTSNLTTDANGNVILYGVWSRPVTFTYYDGASATNVTTNTQIQYYYTDGTVTPNRGKATYVSVSQYNLKTQEQYGWEPIGWALANTGTSQLHINLTSTSSGAPGIGAEAKYYAVYKRPVTLKYNGNGNTGGTTDNTSTDQFFNAGGSSALATNMTLANNGFEKTGYTFDKWIAGTLTGTQHAPGENWSFPNVAWQSSASYDMYAKWNPNTYTVSFDANGGSGGQLLSVTATYGSEMPDILESAPTRTGYKFTGWYDSADVQYYTAAGASARNYDKTENATLYAGWSANCNVITLSTPMASYFNAPSRSTLYVKTGGTTLYIDPNCSTPYTSSHYSSVIPSITTAGQTMRYDKFLGWTNGTDSNMIAGDVDIPKVLLNGDGVVITDYLSNYSITTNTNFTAIFAVGCAENLPNGTCVRNISYSGSTVTVDYDITCNSGYDRDPDEEDRPSITKTCPANCNTITLDANGGTGGSATKLYKLTGSSLVFTDDKCLVEYTSSNYSSIIPSRSGYTFRGFYTADLEDATSDTSNGTQYFQKTGVPSTSFTVNNDTTIYAAWAKNCEIPGNGSCSLSVSDAGAVDYTTSCNGGYTINGNNTYAPTCSANSFTIKYLAGDGATGSMANQTCKYGEVCTVAENSFDREDYNFVGWSCSGSGVSCNGNTIQPGDSLKNATTTDGAVITLTAQWNLGVFTCTAGQTYDGKTCPAGSYCPGGKVAAGTEFGDNGCERACPADTLRGGTVSSGAGSDSISDCYTTRANTATPNGTGRGNQVCGYAVNAAGNDNYAGACSITITWCQGGMYLQANDDTECTGTQPGTYSPEGNITLLKCSDLAGADDTVTSPAGSDAAEDCYNTCSPIAIDNGIRNPVYSTVNYNSPEIPACEYTTKCNSGYIVKGDLCEPDVFEITLNHNGGVSSENTIYLKYNTGWYSDADAQNLITSIALPTDATKTCSGYYYNNTQMIVGADGKLTTDYKVFDKDAEIVASWDAKPTTTCAAGTYYPGTGTTCAECIAGNYCPSVQNVIQGSGQAGMFTCASLNGLYDPATDELGNEMTVEINSAAGAKSASDCFATNVEYKTTYATGAQKCYYNSGAYNDKCTDKLVFTCIAGYYLEDGATDCSKVGQGYYSPEKSLTRGMCPGFGTDPEVTTDSETSESITACKRGNTAIEIDHGYMRARCTHGLDVPSDMTDVSGYKDNCQQGVVVTCDAGYYDDESYQGTGKTPYCVQVEADYWSPDQATCSGSDEIPMADKPGCSTKKNACATGSTTNGATGATSAEACVYTTCEPNYVCAPGEEPKLCSDLTNDEFTLSEAGTTSINGCYKICETPCVEPDSCPTNFASCRYKTNEKRSGKQFYGSTDCVVKDVACEVDLNSFFTYCDSGYYLSEEYPNCLASCTSLEPEGYFRYSTSATLANGSGACYDSCYPTCNYAADYVVGVDGKVTNETVNHCPEHATCTEGIIPDTGYRWYPQEVCTPTEFCSFTFVCDPGYEESTSSAVQYGYVKTLWSGFQTATDVATCTPGTYMVTLDDNGGNGGTGAVYQKYTVGWSLTNFGATVTTVSVPTRVGYTFKGYYDAKTGGNLVIGTDGVLPANTTFTDDTTLYAQWNVITYTITYANMDGATNNIANPSSYNIEQTPMTLAAPTKTGYAFTGWTGDKISDNKIVEGTTGNLTVKANWTPNTFVVYFDPTDATETVVPKVECTYDSPCNAAPAIELEYNTFSGWNTVRDGSGAMYAGGADIANIVTGGEITLYAIWDQNMVDCHAGKYYDNGVEKECPKGQYCPGNGQISDGSTGCIATCPYDGKTTVAGESDIEQCRKVVSGSEAAQTFTNGTAEWDCAYSSDTDEYTRECSAVPLTCNAGYYYDFEARNNECKLVEDGYYSPAPTVADGEKDEASMARNACPGNPNNDGTTSNGIGSVLPRAAITDCTSVCALTTADVLNSKTVTADSEKVNSGSYGEYPACSYTITCNDGYTPQNGTDPKCNANEYTITLDKNGGTGNVDASIKCTFNSGKCALPSTDTLTRAGYVAANQWCENADGSGKCYVAGANTDKNISATGVDTTLYAIWNPGVFKVELAADDATENANQDPIYLKYTVGWYLDSGANTALTLIGSDLPGKSGYNFAGYKLGDVMIVDASGKPISTDAALRATTSDAVANVTWAKGNTTCNAGYYYPGNGGAENCAVCEANHWCPGGTFGTDTGTVAGLNECPDGGLSAGGETATNAGVCYKEALNYTSNTGRATGTQTCNYDDNTKAYDALCRDIVVKTCIGGYYFEADENDIDCIAVGQNYYSNDGDLTRIACPDNGITGEVVDADNAGQCYKTVSYTATNGKGTQVCNYTGKNDDGSARYATDCRDWYINFCNAGYYRVDEADKDCVIAEQNYYSPDGDVNKTQCPTDNVSGVNGITNSMGATSAAACYVEQQPFTTTHGGGVQRCDFNQKNNVYDMCSKRTFQRCDAGYYWDRRNDTDCVPVDYGYFGPVADINNPGYDTARQLCPTFDGRKGLTEDEYSADVSECFMTEVPCGNASTGTGTRTCNYDESAQSYSDTCTTTCEIDGCPSGHYLDSASNTCIECPAGMICGPETGVEGGEDPKACKDLFDGRYPNSDPGSTDTGQCYGTCDVTTNASTMMGRDYQNDALDTCEVKTCKPGYDLENGKCVKCAAGKYCPGDADGDGENDGESETCPASHPNSDAGNADMGKCYTTCAKSANVSTMTGRDYYTAADTCAINTCLPGYKLSGGKCAKCGDGEVCPGDADGDGENDGDVTSCPTSHPHSDNGTSDINMCYTDCAKLANVDTMIGRNYYGRNVADTCEIQKCKSGYYMTDGKASCELCPEGTICDPNSGSDMDGDGVPDGNPKTCAELTNGTHVYAAAGSSSIKDCYMTCETYDIVYGVAIPDNEIEYYNNVCKFKGMSVTDNPCVIEKVNGVETCVEKSCNPDYELIDGYCRKCERENATAYKTNGNCLVAKCHVGFHPDGDQCVADVAQCNIPNADIATKVWNSKLGAYDICRVETCVEGYHVASNACVPDIEACNIANGTGTREWDLRKGTWGDCIVTACKPGFEPDTQSKQCVACPNTFGALGEVAVSSWTKGCTIASCMYQGELYDLRNNECVQICPMTTYTDETGSLKWNDKTKRCERNCEDGFVQW